MARSSSLASQWSTMDSTRRSFPRTIRRQPGGEDGGGGAALVVRPAEVSQGLGPQQRRVARDDDDVTLLVEVIGEDGEADGDGVTRPPLHPLLDELQRDLGLPLQGLDDLV